MATAEKAASSSPHFPPGVLASQFIDTGQQIRMPIKMVKNIHMMMPAMITEAPIWKFRRKKTLFIVTRSSILVQPRQTA